MRALVASPPADFTAANSAELTGYLRQNGDRRVWPRHPAANRCLADRLQRQRRVAMVTVNVGEGGPTDGPVVAKFLDLLHQSGT